MEPAAAPKVPGKAWMLILSVLGPTSGCTVLRSKLVEGRCQVQSLVELVNLAVQSFPWFSPKSV